MAQSIEQLRRAQANNVVMGTVLQRDRNDDLIYHPRRELDEFVNDGDVCNLFLLALHELQYPEIAPTNATPPLPGWSWLEICSIHGRPPGSWNSLTQRTAELSGQITDASFDPANSNHAGNQSLGYCSHGSVLFPSWHRPYLAMMEQALCLKIHEIADRYTFSYRQRFRTAAYRFRFPYLDPYMPRVLLEPDGHSGLEWRCGIPQILSSDTVMVRKWDNPGTLMRLPNPLYDYTFPKSPSGAPLHQFDLSDPFRWGEVWVIGDPPEKDQTPEFWEKLNRSYHHTPNERTFRTPHQTSGRTHHVRMQEDWQKVIAAKGKDLYALFASPLTSYIEFATRSYTRNVRGSIKTETGKQLAIAGQSVESLHDAVHNWAGGTEDWSKDVYMHIQPRGHMLRLRFAAFDPLFWLHHSNVDRIFDIWARLHPREANEEFSSYVFEPTYVSPQGYNETPDSPLLPFLETITPIPLFWTPRSCRDTTTMGYTYAETCDGQDVSIRNLTLPQLQERINTKYLWLKQVGQRDFRPPARALTGFPVDFTRNAQCPPAYALPQPRVWRDRRDTFPNPAIRDPRNNRIRAVRSVNPAQSGVDVEMRRTVEAPGAVANESVDHQSFAAVINTNSIREWEVWVKCEKFSVGGSFYTHFFMDSSSFNPLEWPSTRGYIGAIFNLATPTNSGCSNCDMLAASGTLVSDCLDLTPALRKYLASPESLQPLSLKSLGQDHVVPFLSKYLQWRMTGPNGRILQASDIGQFSVEVVTRVFHPPSSADVLGTYGPYEPAVAITHGKPGGVGFPEMSSP